METIMKSAEVVKKIKKQFNENKNSHIFLFDTNNSSKAINDVKTIIKLVLSANENVSSQIDNENYIELIIIRPEGKEIKKDQIMMLQERIKTKPILSNYMFYIIENAQLLNETASNKLLKTIEEPNDNIIGFLITENIDIMLPTIKSRCEIDSLTYNEEIINSEDFTIINDVVINMIQLIEVKELIDFNVYKNYDKNIEIVLKENGISIANLIKDYYNKACGLNKLNTLDSKTIEIILKNNTYKQLVLKTKYLNQTLNKLTENMNKDLLFEKIFIELKDVKKNANSGN